MVSPCLDTRLNGGTRAIHCFRTSAQRIPENSSEESVPPTAFHFSAVKTDDCGQPKHIASTYPNKRMTSDARLLGNIRRLMETSTNEGMPATHHREIVSSGSNEYELKTKRNKAAKADISNNLEFQRGKESNNRRRVSFEKFKTDGSNNLHFAAKSENSRRRQMATALNAMLGGGPKPRRHSVSLGMGRDLQHQQAPDARNDPYRVHKWRQKSSRRKLAGMQGTPSIDKVEYAEDDFRADNRARKIRRKEMPEDNFLSGDFSRKPRVPLPGVNLLPAMYVSDRSDIGIDGPPNDEVTLSFARNAAMEELERRFHDDSWKSKRGQRRSKVGDSIGRNENQPANAEHREIRRSKFLRRAASLRIAPHEVDGNQRPSVAHTLEDLMEYPDKFTPDRQVLSVILTPAPHTKGDNSLLASGNTDTLLTDVLKYKMVKDTSEETVTIISKPSDDTASFSKITGTVHASITSTGTASTQRTSGTAGHAATVRPKQRRQERHFPVLPEFSKAVNMSTTNDAKIFEKLQETMQKANEQQYQQFSRRASLDRDQPQKSTEEKRIILPPLAASNQAQTMVNKKKSRQRRTKMLQEGVGAEKDNLMETSDTISPLGNSPLTHKKVSISSKTSPLSHVSATTLVKDSTTPVDSINSKSTGRRRSNKWRRRSLRSESKGSPQFQRAQRQTKVAKLMAKWRAAIRLSIMFARLCSDHHIVSDDSYNIHFVRTKSGESTVGSKREVLFDVTDYIAKNQLRLSETTRRILSSVSEDRTEQEIRLVQTALRNIKAISDHSASVQNNIARYGYFAGFGGKRVVVLENRRPLNYYVLLAGSAVVIKSDENGNTNPVWFMKRGDVFGEREILDNGVWEWSVVTVDPCEFLLLEKHEYMRIFLAGGSGGLLSDPDRGTFLKNLSLFRGWPTQLLESNPNRCLFRYYKRGALLAKDNTKSDWIYVVKSGSCSVLKPLKVQEMSPREIFRKQMEEQTATFPVHLIPHLVEKEEAVDEEEHLERMNHAEDNLKADQISVATSYQQIEMASLLKELNIEMKDGILTPVDEEDESDEMEEDYSQINTNSITGRVTIKVTEGDIDPYIPSQNGEEGEFRMSRVSDRKGPARTPSPMKAAYLQTGISSDRNEASRRQHEHVLEETSSNSVQQLSSPPEKTTIEQAGKQLMTTSNVDNLSADDFLSKLASSPDTMEIRPTSDQLKLKPVYVNIRKLTKGCSFGLGPVLFNDQPNLALISNGAECLMLNKKFYLDNMTDEVLQNLREAEHPYPTESDLHESYWRLISWKAFQQRTIQRLNQHRAKVRHYLNPPKTDVY